MLYFMSKRDSAEAAHDLDDLGRDRLGRADEERAVRARAGVELLAGHRRPAALAADPGVRLGVVRPALVERLRVGAAT